jgi:hypothetical protein
LNAEKLLGRIFGSILALTIYTQSDPLRILASIFGGNEIWYRKPENVFGKPSAHIAFLRIRFTF